MFLGLGCTQSLVWVITTGPTSSDSGSTPASLVKDKESLENERSLSRCFGVNQNRTIPVCLLWPPRPCLTIMESVGVCAVVLYLLPLLSRLCVEKAVPWLPGDQLGHRRACTAAVKPECKWHVSLGISRLLCGFPNCLFLCHRTGFLPSCSWNK